MKAYIVKGAMQQDFDDFILASPIIQKFLAAKKVRILIKTTVKENYSTL